MNQMSKYARSTKPLSNIPSLIFSSNKAIIHYKNENKELRGNLKLLNEKLSATLDKLKVKTFKHKDQGNTRVETLERENLNTLKKNEAYTKEIELLEAKLEMGDQLGLLNQLQESLHAKGIEEENLRKELRIKSKDAKISEKKVKQNKDDGEHSTRVYLT